ncbi:methionyl-tRNA formyltransferase [Ammoniphilus oxalaticus]|uniref:Methionyl-tRNA formyltransferase n=1 Tax=Ammoniphilus oxalaticus TaxID=66863 RepID=A0A419SJF2_9BACL|nr:methionyl-tRNA formyltransferase [Ammoniphilus oxalaticus]RKD24143.1 methionyl-tRNA formyltransferase [Ammoniphilus oxalaticus]
MMNVIFMGTPDFAVPCLEKIVAENYNVIAVVTQPDRPKGRRRELTPPPVKEAALQHGLRVFQPEQLQDEAAVDHICSLQPDLIITAAYGQILPKRLIDLPTYGCINVHASLLPRYRGGAPIHQAIIDGNDETGVTIMYMVEKLDAGDILTQVKVSIEADDTVGLLHDKLARAGSQLLLETIPLLIEGMIEPRPQEESEVTYAWNIQREDEKIDWTRSAQEIYDQIRGLNPWPVAYAKLEGKVLKIWRAKVVDPQRQGDEPGTIVNVADEGIDVACGAGLLRLLEVHPSGRKKMSVSDFVRGVGQSLEPGMKLD